MILVELLFYNYFPKAILVGTLCICFFIPGLLFHERFPYCLHLYGIPLARKMTILIMSGICCNLLASGLYFYLYWDFHLFMKNIFMLIIVTFEVQMVMEALVSYNFHFEFKDLKKRMWSHDDAGPEASQQIQNSIRNLRFIRIVITVLLFISGAICLPISGDIREFFCILYIFDDIKTRMWYPFLVVSSFVIKSYLALTFSNPLYILLYVVGDCSYGMMMIREKLRSIEATFGYKEIWYENEGYQKFVRMTLISCIREHNTVKQLHNIVARVVRRNFFMDFLVVVMCFTSFYFNVKMNMSTEVLMKSFSIVLLCVIFSYLFTMVGSMPRAESENLHHDLCNCPWFLWNKSNKSLYLIFLMNTNKPLLINSLNLVFDQAILVNIAKTTMSLLTVLQELTS